MTSFFWKPANLYYIPFKKLKNAKGTPENTFVYEIHLQKSFENLENRLSACDCISVESVIISLIQMINKSNL